ncbi:methyltransferase domain-containing protein [Candidatus Pseudothioglobus singularis]|nr:methyltransferase domain-containing protein [Candidatus Pseudothioglobus singularis]
MKLFKLLSKNYAINHEHKKARHVKNDSNDWSLLNMRYESGSNHDIYSIVGTSKDYRKIIKIEIKPHPRKVNSLSDEINIIQTLNNSNCVSAPKIIDYGRIDHEEVSSLVDQANVTKSNYSDSYQYMIMEKVASHSGYSISDVIISILEQKSLGIYHGDIKPDNICFDKNTGVCCFIDYDQSEYLSSDERSLNAEEFLKWCDSKEKNKYGYDSWIRHFKGLNFNRHIKWLIEDGSFNIATTTPYKKQLTTNTTNGVYHSIHSSIIFANGIRDLNVRKSLLDSISFKENETVLDIGCNAGLLTHYLYSRGCEVTGYEMDNWIVESAKIIANILGVKCKYKSIDIDNVKQLEKFNTICLFSVIHHTRDIKNNGKKIAAACDRILIECRLRENGKKPVIDNGKNKWTKSSTWDYENEEDLLTGLSQLFPGFRVAKNIGYADKNRIILQLLKK